MNKFISYRINMNYPGPLVKHHTLQGQNVLIRNIIRINRVPPMYQITKRFISQHFQSIGSIIGPSLYNSNSYTSSFLLGSFNRPTIADNSALYYISKRFMWKTTQHLRVSSTTFLRQGRPNNLPIKREYPGMFKPVFYKSHVVPGTNLKQLPEHEKHHLKIIKDNLIIGVFTSSPRNQKTGELYHFVSKERFDGSIAPNMNPDGSQNDEGQYIVIFQSPLHLNDPTLIGIDTAKQWYLDKHEILIDMLIKIHQPRNHHTKIRISKNDPMLFHENGQRDHDF